MQFFYGKHVAGRGDRDLLGHYVVNQGVYPLMTIKKKLTKFHYIVAQLFWRSLCIL